MLAAMNTKSWPNWPMPTSPVHTRYAPANPEDFFWDPRYHTAEAGDPDVDLAVRWAKPSGNTIEYQILEALQGKEKQYVLKLAESFEALIQDGRATVVSRPLTAYQRFLVYLCSVYHGLAFGVVPSTHEIYNVRIPSSRVPHRRISDMAPPELTTANLALVATHYGEHNELSKSRPFSRLSAKEKKREIGNSHANSASIHGSGAAVGGDGYIGGGGGEIDQRAPSRDRRFRDSDGGHQAPVEEDKGHASEREQQQREDGISGPTSTPTILSGAPAADESNATPARDLGSTSIDIPKRRHMSIAERQAAYDEARRRIFMDFEEESEASSSTPVPGSAFFGPDRNNSNGLAEANGLSSIPEHEIRNALALTSNTQPKSRSSRIILRTMSLEQVMAFVTDRHKKTEESNNEEDMSESASVSGTIYSYASSRTRSTDYGLYYRRMALSQESLVEESSMFTWRREGVE